MARIRLTLEYEGTAYAGWQVQPNGVTVQQRVEEALQQLLGAAVRIHSSGRTDAGVHALGMVCHFDTQRQLPLSAWREGLNRFLPEDIVVRQAELAADNFHARFSATGKWYRYTVLQSAVRSPVNRRNSWQVRSRLDVESMRRAACLLVGKHDFSAFRTTGCAAETTCREVFSFTVTESGGFLFFDVHGSGFLKNMIRMLVGTLVDIGRGKRPVDDIAALLAGKGSVAPALTAPPQGLCLMEVFY